MSLFTRSQCSEELRRVRSLCWRPRCCSSFPAASCLLGWILSRGAFKNVLAPCNKFVFRVEGDLFKLLSVCCLVNLSLVFVFSLIVFFVFSFECCLLSRLFVVYSSSGVVVYVFSFIFIYFRLNCCLCYLVYQCLRSRLCFEVSFAVLFLLSPACYLVHSSSGVIVSVLVYIYWVSFHLLSVCYLDYSNLKVIAYHLVYIV